MALPGQGKTILGTSGNDKIMGGKLDESILASRGNDWVFAKQGDDYIEGGLGDDRLMGGQGNDWLLGDAGTNRLKGMQGADQFRVDGSGTGADTFIDDLRFGQGDKLVLYAFEPGTFDDRDGFPETVVENDLDVTGNVHTYGEGAVVDSVADLVELVDYSGGTVRAMKGTGNTLILEINDGDAVQTLYLKHLFDDYLAAGGDYVM